MAVNTQHCTLLFSYYLPIKASAQGLDDYNLNLVSSIDTALELISDGLLDAVDLSSIDVPDLDSEISSLQTTLISALTECPALIHIYPQSLIDSVDSSLTVFRSFMPQVMLNNFNNRLASGVKDNIEIIMNSLVASAFDLLKSFDDSLNRSGANTLLNKLEDMEDCLESSCSLIDIGDKIASSLRTGWMITSSGNLNIDGFATNASLIPDKLSTAYDSYISKFNF